MASIKRTGLVLCSVVLLTLLTSGAFKDPTGRAPKDDEGCGPRPSPERPV